jgi:SpoVK/Ycf46/Vps4 family AAA+-type ATPase
MPFSSNTVNNTTTTTNNNNNNTSCATSSSWDSYSNNSNHPNQEKVNAFCTASEVKINNDTSKHNNDTYECESTHPPPSFHTQIPPSSSSTTGQYNPHRPNLTAGLKKKFQLPKPRSSTNTSLPQNNHHKRQAATTNGTNHDNDNNNDQELPEELQHLDAELVRKIENEICDSGDPITFQDIAGLKDAKQTVMELVCWPMKRPDLFTGLRRGPNGLLLFGPPGTGKTLIGKAIAHESGATFFSISSSSLTSKWIGEGEKLVRTLFAVAAYREPAVVFIDEIDSLLTQRKSDENEASRRIKTEFLVQLDGTGTSGQGRVLVIGATNRPHELDDAARRRFVKRLYIPLPEAPDREILLRTLLSKNHHSLTDKDIQKLSNETAGFSGADLKALCTDAALGPIRQLGHRALEVSASDVPPISYKHFRHALKGMNPSVAQSDLDIYLDFNKTYGSKSVTAEDYDGLSDEEEDTD